jgi:site-specific recombinase XerD
MNSSEAVVSLQPADLPQLAGAAELVTEPLDAGAAELVTEGVAEETRRGYAGDLARYATWCAGRGLDPIPATAQRLANYVGYLAGKGKSPATVDRALAAILSAHRLAGAPRPDTKGARAAIRALRQRRAAAGVGVRKATAATVADLRRLVATTDRVSLIGIRDRAIILLGFAGMLRRSEVAALLVGDVAASEEGLTVTVRRSKTDKDAAGAVVAIPFGAHELTCPVRAVAAWRAAAGVIDKALFRRVDRHGRLLGPMTGQAVGMVIARAAEAAGLEGRYRGHSLRRGGATAARRAGHDLVSIGRHGRWKDGSPVLLGYLEDSDRWTDNPMRGVGL